MDKEKCCKIFVSVVEEIKEVEWDTDIMLAAKEAETGVVNKVIVPSKKRNLLFSCVCNGLTLCLTVSTRLRFARDSRLPCILVSRCESERYASNVVLNHRIHFHATPDGRVLALVANCEFMGNNDARKQRAELQEVTDHMLRRFLQMCKVLQSTHNPWEWETIPIRKGAQYRLNIDRPDGMVQVEESPIEEELQRACTVR